MLGLVAIRSGNKGVKMNEVRFRFHLAVIEFYFSIMSLLYEKCNKHIDKAEKILEELDRRKHGR